MQKRTRLARIVPRRSHLLATVLGASLWMAAPAAAQSDRVFDQPGLGPRIFDALVLRPLSFLSLAGSTAAFVPAAIVTSPMGRTGIEEAWEHFVQIPAEAVFERPLGDF